MNRICFGIILLFNLAHPIFAQEEEDTELYIQDEAAVKKKEFKTGYELGFDTHFNTSVNNGIRSGSFGIGPKFAFVQTENFAFGPSIRYQYSWYVYTSSTTTWSTYGGGAFIHYRAFNYFYLSAEFEMLSTPFNQSTGELGVQRYWEPTLFIGGGFSRAWNDFRLNAGVYYDLINDPNSPMRQNYFLRNENGSLIPVIYRIGFFYTL